MLRSPVITRCAPTPSTERRTTLMLWKIDTGTTGFAYRREKIVKPGVELE